MKKTPEMNAFCVEITPSIRVLRGRAIVFMGAEHILGEKLLSEVILCCPAEVTPRALRFCTDYSVVADQPNMVPNLEGEIQRLSIAAGEMLREAVDSKDVDWYRTMLQSGTELRSDLVWDELKFLCMSEPGRLPLDWMLKNSECGILRARVAELVALPKVNRVRASF